MRRLLLLACCLSLVTACRHKEEAPMFMCEGTFQVGGCNFVPQDAASNRLCEGAKDGELIGKVKSTGVRVKLLPERKGKYSRYSLWVWAPNGAQGKAELAAHRGMDHCAVVCKNGSVSSTPKPPDALPPDWVSLVALEGNICLVAWNRKNGGYNRKFYTRTTKGVDAVYKVLEMDDPRYHNEGVPLREMRDN